MLVRLSDETDAISWSTAAKVSGGDFSEPMLFSENSLPRAERFDGIVFFKTGNVLQAIRKKQNSIDVVKPKRARQIGAQAFFKDMGVQ